MRVELWSFLARVQSEQVAVQSETWTVSNAFIGWSIATHWYETGQFERIYVFQCVDHEFGIDNRPKSKTGRYLINSEGGLVLKGFIPFFKFI